MLPDVSIIAPVFNERACIDEFVQEVCDVLDATGMRYELLCIDDGSSDGTKERLVQLATRYPNLRPMELNRHHGQSAALWAGIKVARAELIAITDSDLQNDPRDIATFAVELSQSSDIDCITGVRLLRRDEWLRRASSAIANRVATAILGHQCRDVACATKVCRTSIVRAVPFFDGAHRLLPVLIALVGGVVVERPVRHRFRPKGFSKYGRGLGRTVHALRDALGVRWLKDRRLRFEASDLGTSQREACGPGEER
jgi:dolichol-phosphate mannosyltransferase